MTKKLFQTLSIIALSLTFCLSFIPLSQATDDPPCTNGGCEPEPLPCTDGECRPDPQQDGNFHNNRLVLFPRLEKWMVLFNQKNMMQEEEEFEKYIRKFVFGD